jgi:cysteinyl-tRNA synthetase
MKIYFKNTLSKKIEKFKSIQRRSVGMYHCGPTVYNKAHIGNLSAYIFADVLRRLFTEQKYSVKQIINITDVGHLTDDGDLGDDKVEKAAKDSGKKATEITSEITELFLNDLKKLNIEIDKIIFPKVTDHIEEQIELIQKLEAKGFTYRTTDGIYFNTAKFKGYGILGGINIEGLKAGARIEKSSEKMNKTDFALWKFSELGEKRQQEWESPWGVGFPGWHIECSALSRKYLGETFDIHTGGIDHIPTHHNNEIAQSEAAFEKPLANYWLHVNHIMLNGTKISKSTGNVVYVDDFIAKNISPVVFRYWFLTSHYSTSANFTWESMESSQKAFEKLRNFIKENIPNNSKISKKYYKKALAELNHDLGTAEAIAVIWELIKDKKIKTEIKVATILKIDEILGLNLKNEKGIIEQNIPIEVIELAQKRHTTRIQKNYRKSDEIRNEIEKLGFLIVDKGSEYKIIKK